MSWARGPTFRQASKAGSESSSSGPPTCTDRRFEIHKPMLEYCACDSSERLVHLVVEPILSSSEPRRWAMARCSGSGGSGTESAWRSRPGNPRNWPVASNRINPLHPIGRPEEIEQERCKDDLGIGPHSNYRRIKNGGILDAAHERTLVGPGSIIDRRAKRRSLGSD